MKLIELILELYNWWQKVRGRAEEIKPLDIVAVRDNATFVFAYLLVPSVCLSYWGMKGGFLVMGDTARIPVIYERFQTVISNNVVKPVDATIITFRNQRDDFLIPWNQKLSNVYTTLSPDSLHNNRSQVSVSGDRLQINFPLLGKEPTLSLFATGRSGDKLLSVGDERRFDDMLRLGQIESTSVAMWCFVATIFGFGLVLAPGFERETEMVKNRATKQSCEKNEN